MTQRGRLAFALLASIAPATAALARTSDRQYVRRKLTIPLVPRSRSIDVALGSGGGAALHLRQAR
jgi:hypothetical protein